MADSKPQRRRDLLLLAAAGLPACMVPKQAQVLVEEQSIETLQKSGASAASLVSAYLDRIAAIDRSGPRLSSVIEVNPDAQTIAEELDRRAANQRNLPLHGIPILLKDNIDTRDRMKTTAGSLAMIDAPLPKADAPVVARLREAGAVILGKTNLSEWANIRSSRSSSGWSARGGQARNPYALDRTPSGSSSGSGVAAAASLCAVAIGTETDGSIVSPSSINGLVGIKPTVGLLSGQGIIPIAHSQDTAGPMARTVRDAALVLGVMAGKDYLRDCQDPGALRGARIGICRQMFGTAPGPVGIAEKAMEAMRAAGAELIDPVEIPAANNLWDDELRVLLYELKAGLNAYLAARGGPMRTLADLIAFNKANASKEMPFFGQETFERAQTLGDLQTAEYRQSLEKCRRLSRDEGIDAAFSKYRLDAIFAPTDSPAWPIDWINGDHFTAGSSTLPAVAGYPHITVPGGLAWGLPVGVSFFGPANSESRLIRLAYAFEQRTKARQKPRYLPTVSYA
jgi:amidase